MSFDHFLLTQFNLRNFPKSSNSANDQWLNWTRERIILFKTYCLPSILNQVNKNFRWLIYFDKNTPPEFLPFIEDLKKHEVIEVCYSDGSDDFFQNYLHEVSSRTKRDWIITTRLDNDDALHQDSIDIIQQNFVERHRFLISFASGYVLDVKRKFLAHYYYPMSPFISLIESVAAEPIGIFAMRHAQWPSLRLHIFKEINLQFFAPGKRQARFILKQPLWIQIFHGKNVSNSFYRGFPVLRSVDLVNFGLNFSSAKMSIFDIPKFWNYVHWKRYFKASLVKLLQNK